MRHAALILSLILAAGIQPFALHAQAKIKDTCSIVSSAAIEAALGEPVRQPQDETRDQSSTCRFLSTATPVKYISVMVQHVRDDLSSTKMSDYLKRLLAASAQPVTEVGDDAAWGSLETGGKKIDLMMVRVGKIHDNPDYDQRPSGQCRDDATRRGLGSEDRSPGLT